MLISRRRRAGAAQRDAARALSALGARARRALRAARARRHPARHDRARAGRRRPRGARQAASSRTRSTTRWAWILAAALLAIVPAGLLGGLRLLALRARASDRDGGRSTCTSRPTTWRPRSCRRCSRNDVIAGGDQMAATLFELVRRGRYKMTPVTREESTLLRPAPQGGRRRRPHARRRERRAERRREARRRDLRQAHGAGPRGPLARARRRSRTCRPATGSGSTGAPRRSQSAVKNQARQRKFWSGHGMVMKWLVVRRLPAARRAASSSLGIAGLADPPLVRQDLILTAIGAALVLNAVVVLLLRASVWRRRGPKLQASAEGWEGFRRYLNDFPRLADKPADTLPLWESYLVYGIAFGIAERVLEAARGRLPRHLQLVRLRARPVRVDVQHLELRLGTRRRLRFAFERGLGRRRRRGRLVRRRWRRRLVAAPRWPTRRSTAHCRPRPSGRRRCAALPAGGRPRGRRAVPARRRAALPRVLGSRAAGRLRPPRRHAQGRDPARGRRRGSRLRAGGARLRDRVADCRLRARARLPGRGRRHGRRVGSRADGTRRRGVRAHGGGAGRAGTARRGRLRLGAARRARATSRRATSISRACRSPTPRSCSSGWPRPAASRSARLRALLPDS